jgi:hypothetical protein
LTSLADIYSIDKSTTTAYHPQGNAFAERIHRFFGQALSAYAGVDQSNWDFYLPGLLSVYNGSVHETTGYSPAMLMFGRELSFPGLIPEKDEYFESYPEYVKDLVRRLNYAQLSVMTKVEAERLKRALAQDKITLTEYEVGSQVLLYIPYVKEGEQFKLTPHWTGPFRVVRRALNDKVYYLVNSKGEPLDSPVSIHRLKIYHDRGQMEILNRQAVTPRVAGLFSAGLSRDLISSGAVRNQLEENGINAETMLEADADLMPKDNLDDEVDPSDLIGPLAGQITSVRDVQDLLETEERILRLPNTLSNRKLFSTDQYIIEDGQIVVKSRVAMLGKRTRN